MSPFMEKFKLLLAGFPGILCVQNCNGYVNNIAIKAKIFSILRFLNIIIIIIGLYYIK